MIGFGLIARARASLAPCKLLSHRADRRRVQLSEIVSRSFSPRTGDSWIQSRRHDVTVRGSTCTCTVMTAPDLDRCGKFPRKQHDFALQTATCQPHSRHVRIPRRLYTRVLSKMARIEKDSHRSGNLFVVWSCWSRVYRSRARLTLA